MALNIHFNILYSFWVYLLAVAKDFGVWANFNWRDSFFKVETGNCMI